MIRRIRDKMLIARENCNPGLEKLCHNKVHYDTIFEAERIILWAYNCVTVLLIVAKFCRLEILTE